MNIPIQSFVALAEGRVDFSDLQAVTCQSPFVRQFKRRFPVGFVDVI